MSFSRSRKTCHRRHAGLLSLGPLVVLGSLVLSAPASATGTLDQQQTERDNGSSIEGAEGPNGQVSEAQTFTAGLSGGLDQVDLLIGTYPGTVGPLTVEIRNVAGGAPGSTVLASANVPAAAVPQDDTEFVGVPFASPAPVVAGTQYAIVATTGGADSYLWGLAFGDRYPAGEAFFSFESPPSTWEPHSGDEFIGVDQAFKTYVTTAPPPPSCPAVAPTARSAA